MSGHSFAILDVFTDTALSGNQLGVFPDGAEIDESHYQPLAKELGFSETVFVLPSEDATARVRIFTPTTELPFAGHPVLGTAIYLGARAGSESVSLKTDVGTIPLTIEGASVGRMKQPVPEWSPVSESSELLAALGVRESVLPVEEYALGPRPIFVTLDSPEAVARLRPDLERLAPFPNAISCIAADGDHWKARVFAPALGMAEDAATGSAAGPMAMHLARHGRVGFGEEIEIHQGVEIGRPSVLFATAFGTADAVESIEVKGGAVVVAEGRFTLP